MCPCAQPSADIFVPLNRLWILVLNLRLLTKYPVVLIQFSSERVSCLKRIVHVLQLQNHGHGHTRIPHQFLILGPRVRLCFKREYLLLGASPLVDFENHHQQKASSPHAALGPQESQFGCPRSDWGMKSGKSCVLWLRRRDRKLICYQVDRILYNPRFNLSSLLQIVTGTASEKMLMVSGSLY